MLPSRLHQGLPPNLEYVTIEFPNDLCRTRDESVEILQPNTLTSAESWPHSQTAVASTSTDEMSLHRVSHDDLQLRQQANATLMEVAIPHLKWLSEWLANIAHVVYLVDRDGIILFSTGNYGGADPSGL